MPDKEKGGPDDPAKRWLEAVASIIGAVLAIGTLAIIVWDGVQDAGKPALITVRSEAVHEYAGGYVVEIVALNSGDETAADLLVEGTLGRGGQIVETSEATFDYVPSRSERRGGLIFTLDPKGLELRLRAKGYIEP